MPILSAASKNAMLNATPIVFLSLHTAYDPAGANELVGGTPAYARQAVTFLPAAAGQKSATGLPLTFNVPPPAIGPSLTVWGVGMWDASSNFQGMNPLGGDALRPFALDDTATGALKCATHGFVVGDTLVVWTGETVLPGGLTEGTIYYVVSATLNTLQISTTSGGAAQLPVTAGNGYLQRIIPQTFSAQGTFPVLSFVLDALVAG